MTEGVVTQPREDRTRLTALPTDSLVRWLLVGGLIGLRRLTDAPDTGSTTLRRRHQHAEMSRDGSSRLIKSRSGTLMPRAPKRATRALAVAPC